MIKIEEVSENCDATINGGPIFKGMVLDKAVPEDITLTKGSYVYSLNELSVHEVTAPVAPAKK